MRDDVVEHLPAIDVLEEHVPVIIRPHDIAHTADIRMVQKANNGGLACGPHFFGVVSSLAVGLAVVLVRRLTRHDLYGNLEEDVSNVLAERYACGIMAARSYGDGHTCSPVSTLLASFTLPMLPAPIVLPRAHCPVWGVLIVVLRLVGVACEPERAVSVATPLMGMAEAADASEA